MKKAIILLMTIVTSVFIGCDTESTGNVSRVTVFPELTINGDATIFHVAGTPFNDPGANATVGGSPIEFSTNSNLDTNTPGIYTISYSAFNEDGFEAAAVRTVYVYETGDDIAGIYNGIRDNRGFGGLVLVSTRNDGDYNISDMLAGYYHQGLGYGPAYSFPGVIAVTNGVVTHVQLGMGGFGPVSIQNGSADTSGSSTVMKWFGQLDNYAPFGFDVTFTKITD
ncbi:immunoglobulin-like domain-containing protein [Aestuariivivens marinum]|uniref:immunoglobulin-like domain-containing protein n=1 Tax=Aestuariivivens marinum TaxID=2913555 RepID=UPI001F57F4B1|nr:immunoglobulin-like domain-containing protein [Aestuariivivens marinum]